MTDPVAAWRSFRAARDKLLLSHSQSALAPEQRLAFTGLHYFEYDPQYRVSGKLDAAVEAESIRIELATDGAFSYSRVATIQFTVKGEEATLGLFWIEGYGGGLFLPFRDSTNGIGSFGGGRYLYDTIKGADLGALGDEILLDFNFAYNPSCAYHSQWVCPLAPPGNRLSIPIEAGELDFGLGNS